MRDEVLEEPRGSRGLGSEGSAVAFDERRENDVLRSEPGAEHGLGDLLELALLGDVAHDAEQVAGVDAWRERASSALALEDGDAVDHRRERVTGDGILEFAFGVGEGQSREGSGEELPDDGVEASLLGEARCELPTQALLEGGARPRELLGGGLLGVELDATAATARGAGSAVESAPPDGDDEAKNLASDFAIVGG